MATFAGEGLSLAGDLFLDDAELVKRFTHYIVGRWTDMAAVSIIVYEWLLTLDMEIRLIWHKENTDRKKFPTTKVLYLVNRYGIVADLILNWLRSYDTNVGTCKALVQAVAAITISGLYLSHCILALRVCAVWKMNKIVISILTAAYTASFIFVLTKLYLALRSAEFFTLASSGGCLANIQGSILWIAYVLLLIYDIVMLALMGYPTIKEYQFSYWRTELMARVYVEGIIFYVFLLLTDIVSLTLQKTLPDSVFLFTMPARVLRSVLASRVVLHIREYSSRGVHGLATTEVVSDIRFN